MGETASENMFMGWSCRTKKQIKTNRAKSSYAVYVFRLTDARTGSSGNLGFQIGTGSSTASWIQRQKGNMKKYMF